MRYWVVNGRLVLFLLFSYEIVKSEYYYFMNSIEVYLTVLRGLVFRNNKQ